MKFQLELLMSTKSTGDNHLILEMIPIDSLFFPFFSLHSSLDSIDIIHRCFSLQSIAFRVADDNMYTSFH